MTPGNPLMSPVARPHSGTTDPSQYSSGFYQLPPPLQPFAPPRQSPHQSPALLPQSSHGHSHPLPSLSSLSSPRSTPQMSPLSNHYLVSPALGPLSPYPTPQHHPRRYSSPHQDPLTPNKQAIPTMILPASALSTDSLFPSQSSHQELSPRPYSSMLTQPQKDFKLDSHASSDASMDTTADRTTSTPGSPRRFMMLPPQSPPTPSSSSQRTRSSQSRKSSASSSSGTTSKRRSTSHNKLVDQETRELMRKVSHSAIERRRRERINDKILQLKHLVPSCVDEDHLHKLSILQSTIEYIQYLKSVLPASVANAKVGKATNNNPNNKTTDMLEAMGGSISSKSPLTPLMTTGLNHIYTKRIKLEKQEIKRLLEDPSSILSVERSRTRASTSSSSSSATSPLSPDEDAKDGLLMLAGQTTTSHGLHKRELRKRNSQHD
ncbi:hypothetical protein BGZ51_004032 [Haplosporangium sp. Z 767]|nr:hypothetical protein BGZ51_004032 [Haplosporangium sp. Z 767]KAF9196450.1 hypothetical protein BGZ50_000070 [Haplosporangium sp. Z 11]